MDVFKCSFTELVPIQDLKPNPENNNTHPKEQIDRLAKIIKYQGQRSPIVVSKNTGYIVKGHCRLESLKQLGYTKAAVDYQDYEDYDQEYADLTADNAIAAWAEIDLAAVNLKLETLGPLDIDLLGIKDFTVDMAEKDLPPLDFGKEDKPIKVSCPLCKHEFEIGDSGREVM